VPLDFSLDGAEWDRVERLCLRHTRGVYTRYGCRHAFTLRLEYITVTICTDYAPSV
jgi:hypothetical protein